MKINKKNDRFVEIIAESDENTLCRVDNEPTTSRIGRATIPASDVEKWHEVPLAEYEPEEYRRITREKIRSRYSESDEFKIQRNMIAALLHPEAATIPADSITGVPAQVVAFDEYNDFVSRCKTEAVEEAKIIANIRDNTAI